MSWEVAIILGNIGLIIIFILLSYIIDSMIVKRSDNPLPIAPIFIMLAFLFSLNLILTNKYIIQANEIGINNTNVTNALISFSDTGFQILLWVSIAIAFVSFVIFLRYIIKTFFGRNKGLPRIAGKI